MPLPVFAQAHRDGALAQIRQPQTVQHPASQPPGTIFAPQPSRPRPRDTRTARHREESLIWDSLQQNADGLKVLGSALTVLIWFVYLQLFYRQYRRQQCPHFVIHHAQGGV